MNTGIDIQLHSVFLINLIQLPTNIFLNKLNVLLVLSNQKFMSDDESAYYNAWSSVMGLAQKQLLSTFTHVLRNS